MGRKESIPPALIRARGACGDDDDDEEGDDDHEDESNDEDDDGEVVQ